MVPIIAQIVRFAATQVMKYVGKQATKQLVKQGTKQLGKSIKKQTTVTIKKSSQTGGKTVKKQFAKEKYDIEDNKHFDSLDKILKDKQEIEHSARQQISNYSTFGLPGNMPKTNIFKFP